MTSIGSLFSGAGGLDTAVEDVFGGTVAWHCELDPAASKVLAHRFPGVPNHRDVTAVDWKTVEPVDVLCGGFPCQDVSTAGRRAGMSKDTRSGLWSEMAGAIAILGPRYVVIENVKGLLSAEAHRDMEPGGTAVGNGPGRPVLRAAGAVLGDLADLGYDAQWCVASAADVGAPHRRERVFIIAQTAHTTGAGRQGDLPEAGPGLPRWDRDESVDLLTTPQARDYKGTNSNRGGPWQSLPRDLGTLMPTPAAADGNGGKQRSQASLDGANGKRSIDLPNIARLLPTPSASDGTGGKTSRSGDRIDEPLLGGIARLLPTPSASDGDPNGGPNNPENRLAQGHHVQLIDLGLLPDNKWGKYAAAIERWEQATRPAPSPTETNTRGKPRLNPAFSEWMMGWPDGWVTAAPGISRNDALRIVGNGVCPQQAHAALTYLLNLGVAA